MNRVRRCQGPVVLAFLGGLAAPPFGLAQQQEPVVLAGIRYLRTRATNSQIGETAMIALAMLKADVPKTDPDLAACIAKIRGRFTTSGYAPQRSRGHDIYEAAAVAMALVNLEQTELGGEINLIASYLVGRQNANGSWDYPQRSHGDTSITQYALLGLWECENAGAEIPPSVWDRAAAWHLSVQSPLGSWNYHRDEPQYGETISMTAAGVGSLLICQRQLERFRRSKRGVSPLLTAVVPEASSLQYDIQTSNARIAEGIRRGLAWLGANFSTSGSNIGQSIYYGLYGIERIGALADRQTIGRVDWFEKGANFIRSNQTADGSWIYAPQSGEMNTVWAILFLTRSTTRSVQRVVNRRLGAGTLLGGRGLPKDLTSITVAGGRIMSRPMSGAVEGMLAVLEDPRAQNADAAVSGLIERYHQSGPEVLRPSRERFLKMLKDPDPGLRQVAAWALPRLDELDLAPALIEALGDPDESVAAAAELGLRLLSRKIDGFGPLEPATAEHRAEAARRWRGWFQALRPEAFQNSDSTPAATDSSGRTDNTAEPARSPSR
jgi:hypothetical protein